jgi:hypothetical protein
LDSIEFISSYDNCADIEAVVTTFYSVLYTGLNQFVPIHESTDFSHLRPINTYQIRELLNEKACAWRIYQHPRTADYLHRIKLIASECRSAIFNFHVERVSRVIVSRSDLWKLETSINKYHVLPVPTIHI